jgi:hypothetical protein
MVDAMTNGDACLGDIVSDAQFNVSCLDFWEAHYFLCMGIVFISWLSATSVLVHRLCESRYWRVLFFHLISVVNHVYFFVSLDLL